MKNVMLVDDRPKESYAMKWLNKEPSQGLRIVTTYDEAVAAYTEQCPDLAILDVMMNGTSGFDLSNDINEISPVPVIYTTSLSDDKSQYEAYTKYNAVEFLSKPFSWEGLSLRVQNILDSSWKVERSDPIWVIDRRVNRTKYNIDGYCHVSLRDIIDTSGSSISSLPAPRGIIIVIANSNDLHALDIIAEIVDTKSVPLVVGLPDRSKLSSSTPKAQELHCLNQGAVGCFFGPSTNEYIEVRAQGIDSLTRAMHKSE